jgi:hypothetical protein
MIGIPELLIVIGALTLAGGYVLIVRHMFERVDK